MTHSVRPPLTGGRLDRDGGTRMDEAALDAAWADPGARVVRVRSGRVGMRELGPDSVEVDLVPTFGVRSAEHVYLGRAEGAVYFAVADSEGEPLGPEPAAGWVLPFEFPGPPAGVQGEVMAAALAVLAWRGSSRFSSRDGAELAPAYGGWAALDPHGGEHFPRTDPVVIVRVEHEDRLLLGSNALWESGRFSLLAGFIDAGESAEDAVAREIFEEAGARVDRIRYVTSQPWPFPRSLMLGFSAQLAVGSDPTELHPDPSEISELRWFTRDELRDPPPGITLPMPMSISRWLIDDWMQAGEDARG